MAQILSSSPPDLYISLEFRETLGTQEGPVCGYISGDFSRSLTCELPGICASSGSFHGCCMATTSCSFPTSCMDSNTLSSGCDEACSSNTAIMKCTGSYPYCATRILNEAAMLTQYVCDVTSSVVDEIYTTYFNEGIDQNTISDINVGAGITAATASSTTHTSAGPPSTSGMLSAPLSTPAILSAPSSTSAILPTPSNMSETLPSLPATASPTDLSTTRISNGALAGIGVGVVASLLIGMAIILFYHYHTRHHRSLQLSSSQTPLSAQVQALNILRPDTRVPRTTSNLGRMPRGLQISGSVDAQQRLLASETSE